MKAIELKGIIPPILTPMHDDESINVEAVSYTHLRQRRDLIRAAP